MKRKLTTSGIDGAKPGEIWDALVPGFGLRTTANKAKGFFVMYRLAGRQVRWTFANAGLLPLGEARERARKYLQLARDGIDPQDKGPIVLTVRQVFDRYLTQHVIPNLRDGADKALTRAFETDIFPALGKLPITGVTKAQCVAVWDAVTERGSKVQANRTHSTMAKFFNFCVEKAILSASPMTGTVKPNKETGRDRPLTAAEVTQFWSLTADGSPASRVLRLLLATGQRESEVREMDWSEVHGRVWTIPASRTKTKVKHEVFLSDAALAALGNLNFPVTGRVFDLSYMQLARVQNKLRDAIGGSPFKTHDLRHTFATRLAEDHEVNPYVVDRMLNHAGELKGMAARYNHATFVKAQRAAWELWGRVLEPVEGTVITFKHTA